MRGLSREKNLSIYDIELKDFKRESKGYLDLSLDVSGRLLITEETLVKYIRKESGLNYLNFTITNTTRDQIMITGFWLGAIRPLNPRSEVNCGQVMLDPRAMTWVEIRLPESSAKLGPVRVHFCRVIM